MRRIFGLLACAGVLLLAACGGDLSLPEATGKASIRAINAIQESPEFNFLIEERSLGTVAYQFASSTARYDDLDYTFNIDVRFAGETGLRRIASQFLDVVAGKDYTLLVTGTLANATITLWEDDEREFDAADTVFGAKFAHAAESLGEVDYYFADPAEAPVLGNQAATLAFGEVSPAIDYEAGDFVLTITAAGDPNAVLYTSGTTAFPARDTYFVTSFDGDAGDTAPVAVRAIGTLTGSITLPDPAFPPTTEFVNAAMDLGASDIYDDEPLTSLIAADLGFGEVSAELPVSIGENTFYYTPAGDTTAVTLEATLTAFGGTRYRIVASGLAGDLVALPLVPDRVPFATQVKLSPFSASNNFDFLDIYAVEADSSIEEAFPARPGLPRQAPVSAVPLPAGSYDLYVTEFNDKLVLAGPYRIDVARGDIVDMIILDTVDPAILDVLFLSGGPTP